MAYDSERGKVVLFGGYTIALSADTWEYDGKNWSRIITPSGQLPGEHVAGIVYDTDRKRLLLVGYPDGAPIYSKLWEFDGYDWKEISTQNPPPSGGTIVYDKSRNRVVWYWRGKGTWELEGNSWTNVQTQNSPDGGGKMIYDSVRDRIVLLSTYLRLWQYDGSDWSPINTQTNLPDYLEWRFGLTYNEQTGNIIFHGRRREPGVPPYTNETWEFDGTGWKQIVTQNAPSDRSNFEIIYDSKRNKIRVMTRTAGTVCTF